MKFEPAIPLFYYHIENEISGEFPLKTEERNVPDHIKYNDDAESSILKGSEDKLLQPSIDKDRKNKNFNTFFRFQKNLEEEKYSRLDPRNFLSNNISLPYKFQTQNAFSQFNTCLTQYQIDQRDNEAINKQIYPKTGTLNSQTKKIKKKSSNLNNPEKNLLKIIGNSIISKIIRNNFFNKKIIERTTQIYKIDPKVFTKWVVDKKYIESLINFQSFRELYTDSKIDGEEKNLKLILRKISSWFLENEVYNCFIFEKKFNVDKTLYLTKIPKILEGLSDPARFYSLK